jgi:PIN domain nuclease of toxin-antitoxin system
MELLLDTHSFLWYVTGDTALSTLASSLIADRANRPLVSVVSMWEVAIKYGKGKLLLSKPPEDLFREEMLANDFHLLDLRPHHVFLAGSLPPVVGHKDPFDRVLVAQAQAEGIPLVSGDAALDAYGVTRLW